MAKKRKTPAKSSSTKSDPPTEYAEKVLSGEELTGPLVRAACLRHLTDLTEGPRRGLKWQWVADPDDSPEIKRAIEENDGDPAIRGTGKYVADFFATQL